MHIRHGCLGFICHEKITSVAGIIAIIQQRGHDISPAEVQLAEKFKCSGFTSRFGLRMFPVARFKNNLTNYKVSVPLTACSPCLGRDGVPKGSTPNEKEDCIVRYNKRRGDAWSR